MTERLTDRIELYLQSLPPPTGRTFHQMQPETLLSECLNTINLQSNVIVGYQNDLQKLEKALRKIAKVAEENIETPSDTWVCLDRCVDLAESALGEKKNDQD